MLKNLVKYAIGPVAAALLGLISVPLSTWYIAPTQNGVATLFTTVCDLLMIMLTLGTTNGILRFFHDEHSDGRRRLFLRAATPPIFLFLIMLAVGVFCWRPVSQYIFCTETKSGMLVLAATVFFSLFERYTSLLLRMKERAGIFTFTSIVNKAMYIAILGLFILSKNYSFYAIIVPIMLSWLVTALTGFLVEWKFWTAPTTPKVEHLISEKMFLAYSLPFIFAQLLDYGLTHIDRFVIKEFLTAEDLGIYGAAARIILFLQMLKYAMNLCWGPEIFKRNAEGGETGKITADIFLGFAFITASGMVILIGFIDVFMLLFGPQYGAVRSVAPLLTFVPAMGLLTTISETGINLAKKPMYHLLVGGLVCIFQVVLACSLVKHLGLVGVALAAALASTGMMYGKGMVSYRLTRSPGGLAASIPAFTAVMALAMVNTMWTPPLLPNLIFAAAAETVVIFVYRDTAKTIWERGVGMAGALWVKYK